MQDVIDRANTDQQFRSRLKANPAAVVREAGVDVPHQTTYEVIERGRNDLHFLLGSRTNVPEYDSILERADEDADFRAQLLSDPKSAVEAATGEKLPATCKVQVRKSEPSRTEFTFFWANKTPMASCRRANWQASREATLFAVGIIVGALISSAGTIDGLAAYTKATATGKLKAIDPNLKKPQKT